MPPNLDAIRADLRSRTSYLADGKDVLENLIWYKTQAFDRVVTRDAAEEYDEKYRAYSQSQGCSTPINAPPAPPPATLSAIVRLSTYKYFLTACSDWDPEIHERKLPLKDARPSALAEDPCLPAIEGDFASAWDAIDELIREVVPDEKEVLQALGVIDRAKHSYFGFKIGHKIFEKKGAKGIHPDTEECDGADDEPAFSIENWPVTFPAAQIHLDKLKSTHTARPIPAYNLAGNLIRPSRYASELKGAVVRLEFHLSHWHINCRHIFTADIDRVRVLVPPPPFDTPTPNLKRKRLAKVDDFYDEDMDVLPSTPSKKAKRRA